jgi:hypothetical protein
MIRLYNHQVQSIGMNQILSTFMPDISAERRYFQQNVGIDETGDDFLEQLVVVGGTPIDGLPKELTIFQR